jgi:hypothetical protein
MDYGVWTTSMGRRCRKQENKPKNKVPAPKWYKLPTTSISVLPSLEANEKHLNVL